MKASKRHNIFLLIPFLLSLYACGGGEKNDFGGQVPNNPEGATVLGCNDFNNDITLEDEAGREVDYIIDCLVVVDDIEIEIIDGAVVEFTENSGMIFQQGSRVNIFALAGAVPKVILRGNQSQSGYWKGIRIESDQGSNFMQGVEVHGAGSKSDSRFYGAVTISGGAKLRDSLINNSANYGVYYENDIGTWNEFSNMEITNSASYPVRIGAQEVGELGGAIPPLGITVVNAYSGNNPDRIKVFSEVAEKSMTFRNQGIPFEIDSTITANGILSIEDNVELIFKSGSRLVVNLQISAWDDGGDPIIFRSHDDVAGGWQGILIDTEDGGDGWSTLDNVIIENGGEEIFGSANVSIASGNVKIRNSIIQNSRTCGVRITDPGILSTDLNNTYLNNQAGHICEN